MKIGRTITTVQGVVFFEPSAVGGTVHPQSISDDRDLEKENIHLKASPTIYVCLSPSGNRK
jgi:hypothetical protein